MAVFTGFILLLIMLSTAYLAYRCYLRRNLSTLAALALQVFVFTLAAFNFFSGVNLLNSYFLQGFYIIAGVLTPAAFFINDYVRMISKFKKSGIYDGLIEPVRYDSAQSGETAGARMPANTIIKEFRISSITDSLPSNRDEIIGNIRKSLVRAGYLVEKKEYEGAFDIYNLLTKLIQNNPELYFNFANLCYRMGKYLEAVQLYRKTLDIYNQRCGRTSFGRGANSNQDDEDSGYKMFMVYYNMGNAQYCLSLYEQAVESYRKALDLNPGLEEANENIANALMAVGKTAEAMEFYKKVVENDKNNYRVHFALGRLYAASNKMDEAVSAFRESIRLNPGFAPAYDELGNLLMKNGQYEEAAEVYKRYTFLSPTDYRGFYNLGNALYNNGSRKESVVCFRKAVKINPEDYRSYYNLAIALDDLGEYEEAIDCLKKAIEIKDDFVDAYNNLGITLSTLGRHLEALETYTRGLKKNPEAHSLYYNMGITLSEMGRYEDAADAFKTALEIKPDELEIFYHLGGALVNLRRYDEAVETYKKALKIKPSDSELYYCIAEAYSLMRKYDIALDNLKKAVALNSDYVYAALHNEAFDALRNKKQFRELIS